MADGQPPPMFAAILGLHHIAAGFALWRLIADDGGIADLALGNASFQLLSPARSLSNTARQDFRRRWS